jgi:ATP-dependent RNA helicase DeaD
MKFSELDLKPEILEALTAMGYKELTPIQEKTFFAILDGRDLLARAETGSGKTAACGIPLVQKIDASLNVLKKLAEFRGGQMLSLLPSLADSRWRFKKGN